MNATALFTCLFLICNWTELRAVEYSVVAFGAVNDGKTLNTAAIQAAIDACTRAGGGQVLIPAGGAYLSGTLMLKSRVMLHLENGALLLGSPNMTDYNPDYPHLIFAENAEFTGITGTGTINGNGPAFWDENFEPATRPLPWLRFLNCRYLTFEGVHLLDSPAHVLVLRGCDGAIVNGLRIVNHLQSPNTDGIDVTDSRNVHISNCYIETGDDAICLKSHDTWVENIVAVNNILISDDAAIKFGTGGAVGVRYCVFSNNVIRDSRYGIALFQMDGGRYEHCIFSDMVIHTASRHRTEYPIFVDIDKRRADGALGNIEHITFSNLQLHTRGKCLIAGQRDAPIRHIALENITFRAVTEPAADLTTARKPRGNKTLPYFPDMEDFASVNAWFTLAHTQGLRLQQITIVDEKRRRSRFFRRNIRQ